MKERFLRLQFKMRNLSTGHRFYLSVISLIAMVLALIILLLNLFGVMNPAKTETDSTMNNQLQTFSEQASQNYDDLAAFAISFSRQLEDEIDRFLVKENMTFADLDGNPEKLQTLQDSLYDTVYLNMQLAPSSGAFYLLDASVNGQNDNDLYNGIYLKYINLYSENTVNNQISLYRGAYATGKNQNLSFHSAWQNEMESDFFETEQDAFKNGVHYRLSTTTALSETWERARYVYVPVYDNDKNIIGTCGFEVNDLLFQLTYDTDDVHADGMIRVLFDEIAGHYTGQFNAAGYAGNSETPVPLSLIQKGSETYIHFGTELYVGKTKEITLGGDSFILAVMMPENQYLHIVRRGQMKMVAIFFFVALFAAIFCYIMNKRYVSPILQYEDRLSSLEDAKRLAEAEAQKRKAAYEKALHEYEFAQTQIDLLSDMHKAEMSLDDYLYFVKNLDTLTPTERKIYDMYLEGKKGKEITEILNISENTLKFHNKNLYGKLGVSSRKQLIKLAALKQHEDGATK